MTLDTLPLRMKDLPRDQRGYPVPWFVDWLDGVPEFRAMDRVKFARALRERLCWVCGQRLGVHVSFVAGPMCGVNRTSSEPPSHRECAQWSAINCPFLSNPKMVRREDDLMNNPKLREQAAGFAITRNPGVAMVWTTRSYEVVNVGNGSLITMGEPESVEWFASGRKATREEVDGSIETGLPILEGVARQQAGGIEALRQAQRRLERWLPC